MRLALAAALAVTPGCSGLLYTNITEPLDVNLHDTPVCVANDVGDTKSFQYSVIRIDWDGNGIGQIAKEHGMKVVHYADLNTISVLGIWTQHYVTIYGE